MPSQKIPELVPLERIELSTSPLPRVCSTTELQRRTFGSQSRYSYVVSPKD